MNTEDAVRLLRGGPDGIAEWNRSRAVRSAPTLAQVDLSYVDLGVADLTDTVLTGAILTGAKLQKTELRGCDFSGADLRFAELCDKDLSHCCLTGAQLRGADLRRCVFGIGRDLRGVDFSLANLDEADLRGADLTGARFWEATLWRTHLDGAVLRGLSGLRLWHLFLPFYRPAMVLDETRVRAASFSSVPADPWSLLRLRYSGSKMIFHLLFASLFFLPCLGRAAMWLGVSRLEEAAVPRAIGSIQKASTALAHSPDIQVREWATKAQQSPILSMVAAQLNTHPALDPSPVLQGTRSLLERVEEIRRLLTEASSLAKSEDFHAQAWAQQAETLLLLFRPSFRERLVVRPLWWLVLGLHQDPPYATLALLLITYNVGRAFLTYKTSMLREQDDRSGQAPSWESCQPLFAIHRLLALLFFVVLCSGAVTAWTLIRIPVLVIE